MASVRFDNLHDPRFKVLGKKLGTSHFDAIGRMAFIWDFCTEKNTHKVSETVCNLLADAQNFSDLICDEEVDLGERTSSGIRIKGTKGRIEWLAKARNNGKKGGRPKLTKTKPDGYPLDNRNRTGIEPESNPSLGYASLVSSSLGSAKLSIGETEEKNLTAQSQAIAESSKELSKVPSDKKNEVGLKAREFCAAYIKAYQTKFPGQRPSDIYDGKVQGQIKNFVSTYPLDRAKDLIQVFFQMETKWFGTKGYDFITFRNNLNKIGQALDSGTDPDGNKIDWKKFWSETA